MPGDLCTTPRIISLSPISLATDVTDATLRASGIWLGTRTEGNGTATLKKLKAFLAASHGYIDNRLMSPGTKCKTNREIISTIVSWNKKPKLYKDKKKEAKTQVKINSLRVNQTRWYSSFVLYLCVVRVRVKVCPAVVPQVLQSPVIGKYVYNFVYF